MSQQALSRSPVNWRVRLHKAVTRTSTRWSRWLTCSNAMPLNCGHCGRPRGMPVARSERKRLFDELDGVLSGLGDGELRIMLRLGRRLRLGQNTYGELRFP